MIVRGGKEKLFKIFIKAGGQLAHDIEMALQYLDQFTAIKEVYEQSKKQNATGDEN